MIMTINPLAPNLAQLLSTGTGRSAMNRLLNPTEESFAGILSGAFGEANYLDAADKSSMLDLLIGESNDLSGLLLDAQKAELSLNLAIQIRNKFIDAYNEIIRMQV